jgi:hypothetical protein
MGIDDVALAVRPLIELADPVFTQEREIVHDLFQILAGPDFFPFPKIRPSCHNKKHSTVFAFYSPTKDAEFPRIPRRLFSLS